MKLEGSCHCGAVRFHLDSHSFHPFMHCHCSICRKTAGGGEQYLAACRRNKSGNRAQRRALPGAVGAEQGDYLALFNLQRHAFERLDVAIKAADIAQFK